MRLREGQRVTPPKVSKPKKPRGNVSEKANSTPRRLGERVKEAVRVGAASMASFLKSLKY